MQSELFNHLLLFCRLVIGFVFANSFWGKVKDIPAFERAIIGFDLIPKRFSRPAAVGMLWMELLIVVAMFFNGAWLGLGMLLAGGLLLGFSFALASVLTRKIETPCNCFGPSEKSVTPYDIWRNAGFIACAFGGCGFLVALKNTVSSPVLWEFGLSGLAAVVYISLLTQLGEITQFFRQS